MIALNGIDLNYRPESYWDVEGLLLAPVANIKGSVRKDLVRSGALPINDLEVCQVLLSQDLPHDSRNWWLAVSPEVWGGEFLPDYYRGEVEIARVEFSTRTRDVVSIRARPKRNQIYFRVVDEYDTHITFFPRTSEEPLALEEMILLTETADYGGVLLVDHRGSGIAEAVRVESVFYPDLERYFIARALKHN